MLLSVFQKHEELGAIKRISNCYILCEDFCDVLSYPFIIVVKMENIHPKIFLLPININFTKH